MTSRQAKTQEDTYFRVMQRLQDSPEVSQRQLAEQLQLSLGGINYCLQALLAKGWIKAQNFSNSKTKLGYAYFLTPEGAAEKAGLAGRFLKRKLAEYESLKLEIEALQNAALQQGIPAKAEVDSPPAPATIQANGPSQKNE
jgi:EPS-associated MarR family transcriptional regulator